MCFKHAASRVFLHSAQSHLCVCACMCLCVHWEESHHPGPSAHLRVHPRFPAHLPLKATCLSPLLTSAPCPSFITQAALTLGPHSFWMWTKVSKTLLKKQAQQFINIVVLTVNYRKETETTAKAKFSMKYSALKWRYFIGEQLFDTALMSWCCNMPTCITMTLRKLPHEASILEKT